MADVSLGCANEIPLGWGKMGIFHLRFKLILVTHRTIVDEDIHAIRNSLESQLYAREVHTPPVSPRYHGFGIHVWYSATSLLTMTLATSDDSLTIIFEDDDTTYCDALAKLLADETIRKFGIHLERTAVILYDQHTYRFNSFFELNLPQFAHGSIRDCYVRSGIHEQFKYKNILLDHDWSQYKPPHMSTKRRGIQPPS
jgi:hypothetical protein